MPELIVIDKEGAERLIEARANDTVMEAIRGAGIDDLLALCGGVCSCATCHVYVDPAFAAAITPLSDDENDLLDNSEHRTDQSRLSCQIRLDKELSGLRVTIAPED